ncbi:MAG TPA: hypothetical protein VFK02_19835 [Kofleriaceae bacterium]|nr:hypothetical protein [Kofleriaceae bacterium]
MKKSQEDRRRLTLHKDTVRTLTPRELTVAAAGAIASEKSVSGVSGCPVCSLPG